MPDLDDTPKHADLIYDVGMHKGEDAEFYLRRGFRVVAIEADPDLANLCRQRLREFIVRGRLTVVEGAIVDPASIEARQQKVRLYKNDAVSVWGTVRPDWADRNARLGHSSSVLEVDVIDFSDLLRRHGVPYYMKIDIEGLDMVCVDALRQFRARPDYLSLESDKASYANIEREIMALVELGYDAFQAIEQSAIPSSQSPPNPAREGAFVVHRFEEGSSGLFGSELDGTWKSQAGILRQYRVVRLGYFLLGDDGVLTTWRFRGASRLRSLIGRLLRRLTNAPVPGWYDTHARHSCALAHKA